MTRAHSIENGSDVVHTFTSQRKDRSIDMKRTLGAVFALVLAASMVFQGHTGSVSAAGFCGVDNASGGTGTCVSNGGGGVDANFSPATVSIAPVAFGEFDISAEGGPTNFVTGTATLTVNDLTGADQGWTVNLYATDFDAPGRPTQISASNIYVSGNPIIATGNSVVYTCTSLSTNSADVCSGTSPLGSAFAVGARGIVGNSNASLATPGQIVAYACPNTGGGMTTINVPLTMAVPSEVLPGSYVNNFIAQLYKGPALNNTVCATLVLGRNGSGTPLDGATGAPYDTATNLMLP